LLDGTRVVKAKLVCEVTKIIMVYTWEHTIRVLDLIDHFFLESELVKVVIKL